MGITLKQSLSMKKTLHVLSFLALSIICLNQANATAFASAKVTSLTYEITDLDLNDGITAGINWSYNDIDANGIGFVTVEKFPDVVNETSAFKFGEDFNYNAKTPYSSASVSKSGFDLSSSNLGVVTSQGFANNSETFQAQYIDYDYVNPQPNNYFSLMPNTKVTFHGIAEVNASISPLTSQATEYAKANVAFGIIDNRFFNVSTIVSAEVISSQPDPSNITKTVEFKRSVINELDLLNGPVYSGGSIFVGTYADGFASPAPEPETYILMSLGLLGVSSIVRRRKKFSNS